MRKSIIAKCKIAKYLLKGNGKIFQQFSEKGCTLKKKGILLLSETLLGFPNGSETLKKVFKWLGNPKRVSDSNKIPFFFLECVGVRVRV